MKILTVGDSWTAGDDSSNPKTKSWPAQLSAKYNVDTINLGRGGSSNKRNMRLAVEEVCSNTDIDTVVIGLSMSHWTEMLNKGKWHEIWPNLPKTETEVFTKFWHGWGDFQYLLLECFYFMHTMKALDMNFYVVSLGLFPDRFHKQHLEWIQNYRNDNDFKSLGMPVEELDIGINDLDKKLKALKNIHDKNLLLQDDYLYDVPYNIFGKSQEFYTNEIYGHPNDHGYECLADYIAQKLNITHIDQ